MGNLFTTNEEIMKMVKNHFGETENYLVVLKHNGFTKSLLQLILSKLYYVMDGNRQFILYFDRQGIYEKEFSFTDKADFLLIPWNEIKDFEVRDKGNKVFLDINHLGKTYSYIVEFNNWLLKGNRERFTDLKGHDFYRQDL